MNQHELKTVDIYPAKVDEKPIRVAVRCQTKHPELWRAVKTEGSVVALAKKIGVRHSLLGAWVNLKAYPRYHKMPEYREELSNRLLTVVGFTIEELWPTELQHAIDAKLAAIDESRYLVTCAAQLAENAMRRLTLESPETTLIRNEASEKLHKVISKLSYREREIIKLRYGLSDGHNYTYEEIGHIFQLTRERIRQIEMRAMRKLQGTKHLTGLTEVVPDTWTENRV